MALLACFFLFPIKKLWQALHIPAKQTRQITRNSGMIVKVTG
jgi:hypothetical protein